MPFHRPHQQTQIETHFSPQHQPRSLRIVSHTTLPTRIRYRHRYHLRKRRVPTASSQTVVRDRIHSAPVGDERIHRQCQVHQDGNSSNHKGDLLVKILGQKDRFYLSRYESQRSPISLTHPSIHRLLYD